jgi:hypothetical protein
MVDMRNADYILVGKPYAKWKQNSIISIVTKALGWTAEDFLNSHQKQEMFLFFKTSRLALIPPSLLLNGYLSFYC